MRKIVINTCFGGFGLSKLARKMLGLKSDDAYYQWLADTPRDSAILVGLVEKLGAKANDELASLKIVEIPDDVKWTISDYDGIESVEEIHRSWN